MTNGPDPASILREPDDENGTSLAGDLDAVLDAFPADAAILDTDGRILRANAAWRRFGGLGALRQGTARGDARRAAPANQLPEEVACGIQAVARGERDEFRLVYPYHVTGEVRWIRLHASRVRGEEVRVLVVQEDVTELKRAEGALHDATERLLGAQDAERRRIARELHDGTVGTLVGLSLDLARLILRMPDGDERAIAEGCAALCEQSLCEIRTASYLLHPPLLERAGLAAALRALADGLRRRSGISLSVVTFGESGERLAPGVELALYRIAQEAVVNVYRHSGSHAARIALTLDPGEVRLTVADDGGGPSHFESETGGVGITGMRERLWALGGRLEIRTGAEGTSVTAVVPRATRH